jgi:HD-GYP domain-containing protein (c-di-GMP phosphodiesterase class II)
MTLGLWLRVIGYLFLIGAALYLAYLFAPREWWQRLPLDRIPWPRFRTARRRSPRRRVPAFVQKGRAVAVLEGYDERHVDRIAEVARLLAEAIGMEPEAMVGLHEACYLHDLGMAELAELAAKPGPLALEERQQVEAHPLKGETLAHEHGTHPDAAWWVRWHHERLDGTGYPDRLMGDEIPVPARILAIADAYEALTHRRPYRQALDPQDAQAELRALAGLHYDPWLVSVFTDQVLPRLIGEVDSPTPVEPESVEPA